MRGWRIDPRCTDRTNQQGILRIGFEDGSGRYIYSDTSVADVFGEEVEV